MGGGENCSEEQAERGGAWTNEKHVRYLNSMEASFVRTMLENNGCGLHLRLDRYLPDSSDSTSDLSSSHAIKRKKHAYPPATRTIMDGRADRKTRRVSSDQRHDPSQDQVAKASASVVPELQKKKVDKDGKGPSNVTTATMAPTTGI